MDNRTRANLENILRSAWERQHQSKIPAERLSNSKEIRRPALLDYAIVRMGLPLAVLTLGIGFMTQNLFWYGVVLIYVGLGLFALDVMYE